MTVTKKDSTVSALFPGQHNKFVLTPYKVMRDKIRKELTNSGKMEGVGICRKDEKIKLKILEEWAHKAANQLHPMLWCRPSEIDENYNGGRVGETNHPHVDMLAVSIAEVGYVETPLSLFRDLSSPQWKKPRAGKHRNLSSRKCIEREKVPLNFVIPYYDTTELEKEIGDDAFLRKWFTTENQKKKRPQLEPSTLDTEASLIPDFRAILQTAGLLGKVTPQAGKKLSKSLQQENPALHELLLDRVRNHTIADPAKILDKILKDIHRDFGNIMNTDSKAAKQYYDESGAKPEGEKYRVISTGRLFQADWTNTALSISDQPHSFHHALHYASGRDSAGIIGDRVKLFLDLIRMEKYLGGGAKCIPWDSITFSPSMRGTTAGNAMPYGKEGKKEEGVTVCAEDTPLRLEKKDIRKVMQDLKTGKFRWSDLHCIPGHQKG